MMPQLEGAMALSNEQLNEFSIKYTDNLVLWTMKTFKVNFQDAQDLVQEAFVTADLKRETFNVDSNGEVDPRIFLAWMLRVITYKFRNDSKIKRPLLEPLDNFVVEHCPDPNLLNADRRLQIQTVLEHLPERYREILTMFYLHGLDISQIQQELHMTNSAVKSLLARARKMFLENAIRLNVSYP